MNARRITTLLVVVALAAGLLAPASPATAQARNRPVVVGTDPEGDWNDGEGAEIGHYLGQDLLEAAIWLEDKDTINFILKVAYLPPWGGMPEVTRYTWDFIVDGNERQLDGKWLNYTRGACDPTAGSCPPPTDPGPQPFILRGDCELLEVGVTTFRACQELARVQAVFDPDEGTITIPVPVEALELKPGSKITGGQNTFAGSISAAPSAFATYGAFPMDTMTVDKAFVMPGKKRRAKKR